MTDYIDRETALLSMTPIVKRASERNRNILSAVKQCVEAINWCPAADVAPVRHGAWVAIGKTDPRPGFKCSRCNCLAPTGFMGTFVKSEYCPNCGARMDGDGDA